MSVKKTDRKSKEYLESISFANLVKAIDAKWGHTYLPIDSEEQPTQNS